MQNAGISSTDNSVIHFASQPRHFPSKIENTQRALSEHHQSRPAETKAAEPGVRVWREDSGTVPVRASKRERERERHLGSSSITSKQEFEHEFSEHAHRSA